MKITDKPESPERVIVQWSSLDGKYYYIIGDDDTTGEEVFTKVFGVDDSELIISHINIIDDVVTAYVKTGKLPSNCASGYRELSGKFRFR